MRQAQQGFQHGDQRVAGAALFRFAAVAHHRLGQLQIPVAELVPGEFIQNVGGQIEAIGIQRFAVSLHRTVEFGQDPAVRQRQHFLAAVEAAVLTFRVHQHKAAGVPQLVTEVAVAFQALHVPVDVTAGRGQRRQGEAQGVGAVRFDTVRELLLGALADFFRQLRLHHVAGAFFQQIFQRDAVNHVQRIDDVAFRLGHLLPFVVADQAGHVDRLERDLRLAVFVLHEVHGQHDHARNPEEDDVEAADHHAGRVEGFQRVGLLWPAQGREGPQAGREPGVQHVFVLVQHHVRAQVVLAAHFFFAAANVDFAVHVIPGRNAVAPPQLTGYAPVLNVAHPAEVHVFVLLRHELNFALLNGFHRHFRQRRSAHVPLVGQHRLDHHAAAVAVRHRQVVRFDLFQ
ncbi:hypothetical protein D3C79_625080 [compost metagenome]